MARFKKKSMEVDAEQWFKNGDHSRDDTRPIEAHGETFDSEGKFVRRFRRPDIFGATPCKTCGWPMSKHGWIDHGGDGTTVCPGDWILIEDSGEILLMNDRDFKRVFEPVTT